MLSVEVRIGPWLQRLPEILAAKPEFISNLMQAVGERGKDIARSEAPLGSTGMLRSMIDYEIPAEMQVRIVSRAPHSSPVEYGARPHVIRPRPPKKALTVNSKLFKKVMHPGTRPDPFMLRTRTRMLYDAPDLTLRHVDIWLQI